MILRNAVTLFGNLNLVLLVVENIQLKINLFLVKKKQLQIVSRVNVVKKESQSLPEIVSESYFLRLCALTLTSSKFHAFIYQTTHRDCSK